MKPIQFPPESEEPAAPVTSQPWHTSEHYGFTQRQRAAIDLRVPCSGLDWLDAMIKEARRLDAAQACLPSFDGQPHDIAAQFAIGDANALVAELWPEPPAAATDAGMLAGASATTTASLEPLFATAHPGCRDEAHPPGDWTEGGAYRAVTGEERRRETRPAGIQRWEPEEGVWRDANDYAGPCASDALYRVPTEGGAS